MQFQDKLTNFMFPFRGFKDRDWDIQGSQWRRELQGPGEIAAQWGRQDRKGPSEDFTHDNHDRYETYCSVLLVLCNFDACW